MLLTLPRLVLAFLALALHGPLYGGRAEGADTKPSEVKMDYVGKSFLFDYGEMVIRVHYLSSTSLQWEQVKGPAAGLKGQETYGFDTIRPAVYFIWWQEKDTSIVTQVVDFEKGRVSTTWTSPEKKLAAFQGRVHQQ
jgi:hypothetical protein